MKPLWLLKRVVLYCWPIFKTYKWSVFYTFIGYGLAVLVANVITPLYYKDIINIISSSSPESLDLNRLWTVFFGLAIVSILYQLLYRSSDYAVCYSQSHVIKDTQDFSFSTLTGHSYKFFTDNFAGALVAKSKRFVVAIENLWDVLIYNFLMTGVQLIGTFVVLCLENIFIGIFFFAWCCFYFWTTFYFTKKKLVYDVLRAEVDSKVTAQMADVISNILNLKVFSSQRREIKDFKYTTSQEFEARSKSWNLNNLRMAVQATLLTILEVGGMYLAIHLWIDGVISAGTIVLIQIYFASIFGAVWNLSKAIIKFTESLTNASEMLDILDKPLEVLDSPKAKKTTINKGVIEIKNIDFSYNNNSKVFNDFSLYIPSGQRVGLVGPSGCGKSTLTKLLLRFVDIQKGVIIIDGQDITKIKQDDLRSGITYVPQDPSLFHRTLLENIKYGKPDATMEEVIEAAKKAHAHEFISELPKGYDTLVGERGIKLSGGERQRVAIARAILKDAPIIILDEATSSLDTESEKHIKEAFDELIAGRTTIVIAHRLSTIQKMDRIIVMDKGKIVEDGNHQELLKNEEIYHRFWQYQISE